MPDLSFFVRHCTSFQYILICPCWFVHVDISYSLIQKMLAYYQVQMEGTIHRCWFSHNVCTARAWGARVLMKTNLWGSEARRWEQIRCSRPVSNTLHVLKYVGMLLDFLLLLSPSWLSTSKFGLHEDLCPSCPCGTNIIAKSTSVDRAFWGYREKNEQTHTSLYWKVAHNEERPEIRSKLIIIKNL